MSSVLWPRLEVLQLITKNIDIQEETIKVSQIIEVAKFLKRKKKNKISFKDWELLSRDYFEWNDEKVHFYWELLCFAVYFFNHDLKVILSAKHIKDNKVQDEKIIETESLIIFLCLLINDPSSWLELNLYPEIVNEELLHEISAAEDHTFLGDVHPSVLNIQGQTATLISPSDSPKQITLNKENDKEIIGIEFDKDNEKDIEKNVEKEKLFNFINLDENSVPPIPPASPPTSPKSIQSEDTIYPDTSQVKSPHSHLNYILTIRRKVPLIFHVLKIASKAVAEEEEASLDQLSSPTGHTYQLSKKIVNKLGMILCGGFSREQAIFPLSKVYPLWASENSIRSSFLSSKEDSSSLISVRTFLEWMNKYLVMNDIVYPTSTLPNLGTSLYSPSSLDKPHIINASIASISRFIPVYLNEIKKNTIIYILSSNPSRSLSFRRKSTSSPTSIEVKSNKKSFSMIPKNPPFNPSMDTIDEIATNILNSGAPSRRKSSPFLDISLINGNIGKEIRSASSTPKLSGYESSDRDQDEIDEEVKIQQENTGLSYDDIKIIRETAMAFNSVINSPENNLSPLFLSNSINSYIYFLSPFYYVNINNCKGCKLLIGPTFGSINITNCQDLIITCFCKKLIISNSQRCKISLATLSPSIISECEEITIGPVNTVYKTLRNHLKLADLVDLMNEEEIDENGKKVKRFNFWDCLWNTEEKKYVEAENFVNEEIVDNEINKCIFKFLSPLDFIFYSVPHKDEYLEFKHCPIPLEKKFMMAYKKSNKKLSKILNIFTENFNDSRNLTSIHTEEVKDSNDLSETEKECINLSESIIETNKTIRSTQEEYESDSEDSLMNHDAVKVEFDEVMEKFNATSAISQKFMNWLVENDYVNEILDLITLDSDKSLTITL